MAQNTWQHTEFVADWNVKISDAVELPDGFLAVRTQFHGQPDSVIQDHVLRLGIDGEPMDRIRIWNDDHSGSVRVILPSAVSGTFHVLGRYTDTDQQEGFYHYLTNPALVRLDSARYRWSGMTEVGLDNAVSSSTGKLLLPGSGMYNSLVWNRGLLLLLDANGDSLTSTIITSNAPYFLPRSAVNLGVDTFWVACAGEADYPEYISSMSYMRFGPNLEHLGGQPGVVFTPPGPLQFSFLNDQPTLLPLPSGNTILAGRSRDDRGVISAVQKLNRNWETTATFLPRSEFDNDQPGVLNAACNTADGNILFATITNFFAGFSVGTPYLPDAPSQIRVYKLDTALNLLCTHIVDGFAENAYYWLDRIKPTSDGGFLLMGSRVDLDAGMRFDGWIRKFSAEDCFTAITEADPMQQARVFPNPGHDQFEIALNGVVTPNCMVTLNDEWGRSVGTKRLSSGRAIVDTKALAVGMYAYRVTDTNGHIVLAGRWIKQ